MTNLDTYEGSEALAMTRHVNNGFQEDVARLKRAIHRARFDKYLGTERRNYLIDNLWREINAIRQFAALED